MTATAEAGFISPAKSSPASRMRSLYFLATAPGPVSSILERRLFTLDTIWNIAPPPALKTPVSRNYPESSPSRADGGFLGR
jgi:hypothetical protein